jgi:ABC-type polysaccharide/polyol phosphate transport system ATPase subunit
MNGDAARRRRLPPGSPVSIVPAPPVLVLEHVSKSYVLASHRALLRGRIAALFTGQLHETFTAVRDVSLTLDHGKSLALVGPNGAGKSTLLRLMAGLSRPDTGSVTMRGRMSALMELGAGFHPDLSGAENVYLNAALLGFNREQARGQFDQIVEFAGIGKFIDEPLRTYSNGMVLRLAFSVAVRVSPDILIIDEILAVGDQDFYKKSVDEIRRLRASGTTLVCASHAVGLLREVCDQALWIDHGEVRGFGPTDRILTEYGASSAG